jgi:hypothetical protein
MRRLGESKPSYNTGLPTPPALHGWNDTGSGDAGLQLRARPLGQEPRRPIAAATSEDAAARADAAAARLIVSTSIAAAYADLARCSPIATSWPPRWRCVSRPSTLVRRRTERGYDSEAELRQAEVGPPLARAELEAIDEQIALTRLRLAALMGQAPDRAATIEPARGGPACGAWACLSDLPSALIARRPDLVAARWRAEAASERIDVAHAAFYPNVNLVGLIGVQSLGIGNLADAGSDLGSAGVVLGLPIFDGGRRKAGFKVARADYDAAVAAYDATLNLALEEVADAVTSQRALEPAPGRKPVRPRTRRPESLEPGQAALHGRRDRLHGRAGRRRSDAGHATRGVGAGGAAVHPRPGACPRVGRRLAGGGGMTYRRLTRGELPVDTVALARFLIGKVVSPASPRGSGRASLSGRWSRSTGSRSCSRTGGLESRRS